MLMLNLNCFEQQRKLLHVFYYMTVIGNYNDCMYATPLVQCRPPLLIHANGADEKLKTAGGELNMSWIYELPRQENIFNAVFIIKSGMLQREAAC